MTDELENNEPEDLSEKTRDEKGQYLSLKREVRFVKIVETMLGAPGNATITAIAERLGVTRQTIYDDFNHPQFEKYRRMAINSFINNNLAIQAMKNIARAIIQEGDVKVSQWLIEMITPKRIEFEHSRPPMDEVMDEILEHLNNLDPSDLDGLVTIEFNPEQNHNGNNNEN